MAKVPISGKLAVILHADVAGSTALVQQDKELAHERIQDAFRRFSATIEKYNGNVLELRGDAFLAEFERAYDAVTAALSFQAEHTDYLSNVRVLFRPSVSNNWRARAAYALPQRFMKRFQSVCRSIWRALVSKF
jgi:class 3 adenylate cyclase